MGACPLCSIVEVDSSVCTVVCVCVCVRERDSLVTVYEIAAADAAISMKAEIVAC